MVDTVADFTINMIIVHFLVERVLQETVHRVRTNHRRVHRAENLDIVHRVERLAVFITEILDILFQDSKNKIDRLLRVIRIDVEEIRSLLIGKVRHDAVIHTMRIGNNVASCRLPIDFRKAGDRNDMGINNIF